MVDEARRPAGDDLHQRDRALPARSRRRPGPLLRASPWGRRQAIAGPPGDRLPSAIVTYLAGTARIAPSCGSRPSVGSGLDADSPDGPVDAEHRARALHAGVYHSPGLAGIVTFASLFPACCEPDRRGPARPPRPDPPHRRGLRGRPRSLVLIGSLALAGQLPSWLLVSIAWSRRSRATSATRACAALPGPRPRTPLGTGQRRRLERLRGATIIGPPLAAGLVGDDRGPDPRSSPSPPPSASRSSWSSASRSRTWRTATTGRLLADAWQGLLYWWRNRTHRGLASPSPSSTWRAG